MNPEPLFDLVTFNKFLNHPEQFKVYKKERITMYNDRLQTKTQLTAAVKGSNYIVGSFTEGQGISFSATPSVHYTSQSARAECKRLAKANPNKTFVFVKLMGGEEAITQPQFISI